MLLIDSSVWIDFFNGKETAHTFYLRDKVERTEILVGDLILCEVLQGFKSDKEYQETREILLSFTQQEMINQTIALQSANLNHHKPLTIE